MFLQLGLLAPKWKTHILHCLLNVSMWVRDSNSTCPKWTHHGSHPNSQPVLPILERQQPGLPRCNNLWYSHKLGDTFVPPLTSHIQSNTEPRWIYFLNLKYNPFSPFLLSLSNTRDSPVPSHQSHPLFSHENIISKIQIYSWLFVLEIPQQLPWQILYYDRPDFPCPELCFVYVDPSWLKCSSSLSLPDKHLSGLTAKSHSLESLTCCFFYVLPHILYQLLSQHISHWCQLFLCAYLLNKATNS